MHLLTLRRDIVSHRAHPIRLRVRRRFCCAERGQQCLMSGEDRAELTHHCLVDEDNGMALSLRHAHRFLQAKQDPL